MFAIYRLSAVFLIFFPKKMKYYGASNDDSFYYLLLQVGAEKSLLSNLRKIHSSINTEVVIDRIRSIARYAGNNRLLYSPWDLTPDLKIRLAGLMKLHKTNIIHQDIKWVFSGVVLKLFQDLKCEWKAAKYHSYTLWWTRRKKYHWFYCRFRNVWYIQPFTC